jgi:hypothetical protein
MQTLDDAWNTQDFDAYDERHKPGPMVQADGPKIPPTGKSFEVDFCTVAR